MKRTTQNYFKQPVLLALVVLMTFALSGLEPALGNNGKNNGKVDKCKTHDRCKEHDKCRKHDKAHEDCRPAIDRCKDHDRCREHDMCKQHEKRHKKCNSKPQVRYSGRAVLVNLTNLHTGPATIIIGDTGPVPAKGGELSVVVGPTNITDDLFLELGQGTVSAVSNVAQSTVIITNFGITITTTNGVEHTLVFDYLEITATAECTTNGPVVGSSLILEGLELDGALLALNIDTNTGAILPNQTITFDGGSLVIFAQASSVHGHVGDITAAGIVIQLDGCMLGPIGLVHADIHCGKRGHAACSDRVTGGGFIFGTPSGQRANFGVGGGLVNDKFWGHLNYIDHGTKMHVKSKAVTSYTVVDATTRSMTYDVTINGVAGTATVVVTDVGEPGRDDIFMITLSNGYMAGGDLGGPNPGGGNIQLHKSKCK